MNAGKLATRALWASFYELHVLNMAAIGSLVFCTDCGNLLEGSSGDKKAILTCAVCGTENKGNSWSVFFSIVVCCITYLANMHRYFINHYKN